MNIEIQRQVAIDELLRRLWEYVNIKRPTRAERERAELTLGTLARYLEDMR